MMAKSLFLDYQIDLMILITLSFSCLCFNNFKDSALDFRFFYWKHKQVSLPMDMNTNGYE